LRRWDPIQADAYAGFNAPYTGVRGIEAACCTHARRYFHDELLTNGSPIAREAIARMQALFATEAEIHRQSPEARLAARQARSAPLMADLRAWLEATLRRISGKSDLAKSIRYTLAPWTALTTVLRDGRARLHNNAAGRQMRPLALGRERRLLPMRQTLAKRMRAKLLEVKETLDRMRHLPVPEQGRWMGQVMRGNFAYQPCPPAQRRISAFAFHTARALAAHADAAQPNDFRHDAGCDVEPMYVVRPARAGSVPSSRANSATR
jgi:hypothetical protein